MCLRPMAVKTTTTELDRSRVRVEVEVEPAAVERELAAAAKDLASEMKMPGFRKGKVPPEVVLRQLGREAVLDQALRRALPAWYEEAVSDARVATVGDPKLDLADLPEKGNPLSFTIEVGVRPKAELGDYKGVEAGRREATATDEEVDAELEAQREALASLENVDRRGGQGRLRGARLRREGGRRALRGRRGARIPARAGLATSHPRLRGAARGGEGRRQARRDGHLPRGLRRRGDGRQGGRLRDRGQGDQGEAAARARRRLRRRRRRLRLARGDA